EGDLPLADRLLAVTDGLQPLADLRLQRRPRGGRGLDLLLPLPEGPLLLRELLPGREDPLRLRELLLGPHQAGLQGAHPVRGLLRLRGARLEVRDHLREARLPRGRLGLPGLARLHLRKHLLALPREGVPLGREAVPLPDEDLPLPVERGLRGLEGLLLDTGLGELDLEELPLSLDSGLLELLDVPAGAGDRLLPPGDLLLLGREAPPFRARLVELLRHAARLPRQRDRGGLHLCLILRALRFLVGNGPAPRAGPRLPPR